MRKHTLKAHDMARRCVLVLGLGIVVAPAGAEVVVEALPAGSALARDGIEVGDRLVTWQRMDGLSGIIDSPFHWWWLGIEQASRGAIRLEGERRGKPLEVIVAPGSWEAEVRPDLPRDLLTAYRKGAVRLLAGDFTAAAGVWRRAATSAEAPQVRGWLQFRAGGVLTQAGEPEAAGKTLRDALALVETPEARVAILRSLALALRHQNKFVASEDALRSALAVWQSEWPDSLGEVDIWTHLSEVAETRGELDAASSWLTRASDRLDAVAPISIARARVWTAQGRDAYSRGQYARAEAAHGRSAELLEQLAPETVNMAVAWMNLGVVPVAMGDLEVAEDYHLRAWALFERLEPSSLNSAACLGNLGAITFLRGDLEAAEENFLRALEIRQHHNPGGIAVANNLSNLGEVATSRGDLERARDYYRRALEIQQVLAPDSVDVAGTLINLGSLAIEYGDLVEAEILYQRALALQEKLAPEGIETAVTLLSLGQIVQHRGDFAGAETWYRRALDVQERSAPGGENMATLQANLGGILMERGDLFAAEEHLQQALSLRQKQAPDGLEVAEVWNALGILAERQERFEVAAEFQNRALAIQEAVAPDSLRLTRSLISLGRLALESGEHLKARKYLRRSLGILEPLVPNSQMTAIALQALGEVDFTADDLESAHVHFVRALDLFDRQGAESFHQAECLDFLARIARLRDQPELAWQRLERAVQILEAQIGRLGGARELHGSFRARYGHVYRAAIEVLLELGRPSDAFEMLESRRARGLLAMLAERDLVFADVPAELESNRRRLAVRYDSTLRQMAKPDVTFEQAEDLRRTLEQLQSERRDLQTRIREASPRLAELEDPRPSSLREIRVALDPGTVLLSYSVGNKTSRLFALSRKGGHQVFDLGVGESELRQAVSGLRTLIEERRNPASRAFQPLVATAASLFDRLLSPARAVIARGERLLIVPDGPLFQLPFGVLIDSAPDEGWQYLIEQKAVHTVVSGTIYARLRAPRDPSTRAPTQQLVAFGDPVYPTHLEEIGRAEPQVRSAAHLFDLQPLPGSRDEAERIAGLYPRGAELLLGEEATEERAKSLKRNTRYVHFAAHGLLNERFPLDSAVALSLRDQPAAGQENGLLQVWEIFERVRVDADLVVLSACQTAGGEYVDGEGLIGLTRAFHYAGARSVVASLWSVDDRATSELMFYFYRGLRQGLDKDSALRSAQLTLLGPGEGGQAEVGTSVDRSAPYYWSAFQLYGDRR